MDWAFSELRACEEISVHVLQSLVVGLLTYHDCGRCIEATVKKALDEVSDRSGG
jgi:hypothetical protein